VDGLSEANREKMELLMERLEAEAAGGGDAPCAGSAAALLAAADALLPAMGPPARLSINQLLQWHDATSAERAGSLGAAGAKPAAQE
jgi:hypothetical protein